MYDIKALKDKVKDIKLLFVDDEKEVRDGTGLFLKKFFDDVVICDNGEDGYNTFVKENGFDVVVTDIAMPKMNGVEMAKKIKDINPKTYIVFLSASRSLADSETALSFMSMQKPLSFEDMIDFLDKLEKERCWN